MTLLSMLVVLGLVVAACGDDDAGPTTTTADAEAPETTGAPTEATEAPSDDPSDEPAGAMEMWSRSGGQLELVEALVAQWNEENPGRPINLSVIEHDQMVAQFARSLAAGEPPALLAFDLIYTPEFASAGQLEDLTDEFLDDPLLETASPGHIEVSLWEDRLYGVPFWVDVSALFWNKDLFREAGLDPERPPTNMAEIKEYAEQISALGDDIYGYYLAGNCAGCNIFTFAPYIWASDPDARIEARFPGDDALVGDIAPVLEWARSLHQEGLIDPASQPDTGDLWVNSFGAGNVGMMGHGNFVITLVKGAEGIEGQNPDLDFGITPIPGMETGQASSFIGGDVLVVPRGSDRRDDAVDFMRWVLSDEVQVETFARLGALTTRSDMADNPYFTDNPLVQDVAEAIPVGTTPYTTKFFEQINSPNGPWLQMLQRVYYTDDDIEDIMADARQQMLDIINE